MSIATLIVIFGILWLGKSNIFIHGLHLSVLVENANGISVGDEVYYSGLKVGTINSTEITRNGILLHAKIEKIKKIPVDSKFYITDYSMIGGKVLEIEPGISEKFLQNNQIVHGDVSPGLSDAITKITDLSPKIDKLLDNLNNLTGQKTEGNVLSVLADLQQTLKGINSIVKGELKESIRNVNNFTSKNSTKFSELITALTSNSRKLEMFIGKSTEAANGLDSLLKNINSGNGTLGELNRNKDLYNNLNSSVIALDSLLKDIKKNPKKYFRIRVL